MSIVDEGRSVAVRCPRCGGKNAWRAFEGDLTADGKHVWARLHCLTPGCRGRLVRRWLTDEAAQVE
jgi:hypothetical protein